MSRFVPVLALTSRADRFFWLVVRSLYPDWKQHLILVRPETVVRWHRQGRRLYWRWRSGHQLGRPRLSPEIRELIATMASENPSGAPSVSAANSSRADHGLPVVRVDEARQDVLRRQVAAPTLWQPDRLASSIVL
jgi:hypothetical protein